MPRHRHACIILVGHLSVAKVVFSSRHVYKKVIFSFSPDFSFYEPHFPLGDNFTAGIGKKRHHDVCREGEQESISFPFDLDWHLTWQSLGWSILIWAWQRARRKYEPLGLRRHSQQRAQRTDTFVLPSIGASVWTLVCLSDRRFGSLFFIISSA